MADGIVESDKSSENMPTRRDALVALSVCACCTAIGTTATDASAQPDDRVPAARKGPQDAGPIANFANDGVYDTFSRNKQFFVSRSENTIRAFSSICTHRRCVVRKQDDTVLKCPCHQAEYDANGVFTKRPATVSLPHYAVSLNDQGHLIVDTSKSFEEANWEDPAANLKIETPTTQET